MVFVDDVDEGIALESHLRSFLLESMRGNGKEIIRCCLSFLIVSTREYFMQELERGNTRTLMCIDDAGMGVNLRDVTRAIQWKIRKHLTLAALLQRIG